MPNIRKVKVTKSGTVRTLKVCTSCIRAGKIVKAGKAV